jgi:hypothetical protein
MISQFGFNSWSLFTVVFTLLLLWGLACTFEWAWFRPRRLDRALRNQGLRGTVYQSLAGDVKENTRLNKEARAQLMPLSHDITARVEPLLHSTMNKYGEISYDNKDIFYQIR